MSSAARKFEPLMTVDEFLEWDGDGTGLTYDLVDGQPRAHAAPSGTHATMHTRMATILTNHLDAVKPQCRVMIGAGVRPALRADWNFRVPDLLVTCVRNERGERDAPSPSVIVELLSPSNTAETWDNVRNYMTLPSVKEIHLISTLRVAAQVLRRKADGHWPGEPDDIGPDGTLTFEPIDLVLPLKAAYKGTYLE
jgi:Uma2 family endonuclease